MVEHGIGLPLWVEGGGIETAASVFDRRTQPVVAQAQPDLDVLGGCAVADGVGARFFDRQDDVVDDGLVGAVLGEVVTDALTHAQ